MSLMTLFAYGCQDVIMDNRIMKYYQIDRYVKDCSICYSDFKSHDKVEIVGNCDHCFHHYCLQQWLQTSPPNHDCPLCMMEDSDSDSDSNSQ